MAALPVFAWFCVRNEQELPPVVRPPGAKAGNAWDLAREPMFRRLLLVNWVLASCWDVSPSWCRCWATKRGLSASVIGTILGAFAVAAPDPRGLLPLIAARLQEWR